MCANWISVLQALLTPTIAMVGLVIGFLQWRTNHLKRKNELFDRRYEFYYRFREWWLNTGRKPDYAQREIDVDDLLPWGEEASFLFGNDIVRHICSFVGDCHDGMSYFPGDNFSLPFKKYLKWE
jgi:hypothetical protein